MYSLFTQLKPPRPRKTLAAWVLASVILGIILPAILGIQILTSTKERETLSAVDRELSNRADILVNSLFQPLWNFDDATTESIVNSMFYDDSVVSITVFDSAHKPFVSRQSEVPANGSLREISVDISRDNQLAGFLEIQLSDATWYAQMNSEIRSASYILALQLLLSVAIIMLALRKRVIAPLRRLTVFAKRISEGELQHQSGIVSEDEIGFLARSLDQMSDDLDAMFLEQRAVFDNVRLAILFIQDGYVRLANNHAYQVFGSPDVQGINATQLFNGQTGFEDIYQRAMAKCMGSQSHLEEEVVLLRADGREFWANLRISCLDKSNLSSGSIWVVEDITEQKRHQAHIDKLAFYDPLTDLPNRRLLKARLSDAMHRSDERGLCSAIIFLDLDDFKDLNDTRGHTVGDQLLHAVGLRLTSSSRQGDTVARIGGDEFVILIEDIAADLEQSEYISEGYCEKVMANMKPSFHIGGQQYTGSCSLGVVTFQGHTVPMDELLKQADLAMYEAKAQGKNTYRVYNARMQSQLLERTRKEQDIRQGLIDQQFFLEFQPQVDTSGRVRSAEVLVRLQHPSGRLIPPCEFIATAEASGQIVEIGNWVLEQACRKSVEMADIPELSECHLSVNVSVVQFSRKEFITEVSSIIQRTGANPALIRLEITESLLALDLDEIVCKMKELSSIGVTFALDDFGTGYSSLSYLKHLPFHELKIDRSFIQNIETDSNDQAIALMIICLADSLGLPVIAEGVEEKGQLEKLGSLGCNLFQGYYFCKPVGFEALIQYARTRALNGHIV